jgi:hypothetical protein
MSSQLVSSLRISLCDSMTMGYGWFLAGTIFVDHD